MGLVLLLMMFVSMIILGVIERRISRQRYEVARQRLRQLQTREPEEKDPEIQLSRNSS